MRFPGAGHAELLEIGDQTAASFGELALAVPRKTADAVRAFLQPRATRPGGDAIRVPPMSGDWLVQHEAACGKHGDD